MPCTRPSDNDKCMRARLTPVNVQIMVRYGTYQLSASFLDIKTLPDWTQEKPAVSVEAE